VNDHDELDELERELGASLRLGLRRAAAEITEEHRPHAPALRANGPPTPGTRFDDADLEPLEPPGIDATVMSLEPTPDKRAGRGRWLVAAAAAAAAALIVGAAVIVRTVSDDGVEVIAPAGPAATTNPPPSPPPLPDGLKGLPPAGATPSTPATGQLLATLPIPIWVYEDGRVISARWTTHDDWTGFLEQRLTPEGVELVRAEILALEPLPWNSARGANCHFSGGNYAYTDGERIVCESPGGTSLYRQDPQFLRLSELQYGAPSWLPASAWADPEPKPYVPSTYQIRISSRSDTDEAPPPIDASAMRAALPPEAAELLTVPTQCPAGPTMCFKVSTEEARQLRTAVGITWPSWNDRGGDNGTPLGVFGGYYISLVPYLPHDGPAWCCGG
jgi:hypothetical protein